MNTTRSTAAEFRTFSVHFDGAWTNAENALIDDAASGVDAIIYRLATVDTGPTWIAIKASVESGDCCYMASRTGPVGILRAASAKGLAAFFRALVQRP